jgi:hypothetical protein
MDRRDFFTAGVAATVAAGALVAVPAEADPDNDQGIVGSWFGTVTATDPPLGQFNDLISFNQDGVVTESRRYLVPGTPIGTLLETTGHGAWKKTGGQRFEAFFRFLLQNADTGDPVGTDNVRLSLTVDRAGNALTGTFQSQVKDTADNVLITVTGDYTATRIAV